MKLFRNKDFRRALVWHIAVGATLTVAGALVSPVCGAMLFAAAVLFTVLHAVFTARRYRNLAALCDEIDRILHTQQPLLTMRQDEGELSVLISEIQKMTLRLKEQTDRLQQEKQHLKTAIEDIFHQLRTPLTAMELSVSLLREETLPDERRIQLARELHAQLSRTASLIETLLKLSKIDAGAVQFRSDETSVRDVVERAAQPFGIAMELRGQNLQLSIGDEHFCGDLLWTTEAVGNLIKNCVEHTPDGGEITVTAKETALFTQIEMSMRNNSLFLRNSFVTSGKWDIPLIQGQHFQLSNPQALACSQTRSNESNELKRFGVHFFVDDYRFCNIFNHPERSFPKYAQYAFLFSPDYSLYADMPLWMQMENVAKNRWCGAYWQSKGKIVIPTVSWSDASSYSFCFDGIERNASVAIGMIGCKHARLPFLRGYATMLDRLSPQYIYVVGTPFPEMEGNIIPVFYPKTRKGAA